ncbi:hypothetical protein [Mesorhizobium sp. M1348]|uniref:hypothetical protein n=1 Tax=Mesorhizobium sp. M1348 TaxID=2957089 RepID=UPI00333D4CC7
MLLPLLVLLTWPLAMGKYFAPASSLWGLLRRQRTSPAWPSQLRSIAAESALMLADALAGGRFTRHNDLLLPAGIIAGAGDRLFDMKAEALRLQSEIPSSFVDIIPQAGHMVHHTAPHR